jgi:dTDP-glucose pyrophosphorylase
MQLIIPMSGTGKRFVDKGYVLPKPLIPISGKPMIQHVVEMFPGVEEILFIVNRNHYEDVNLDLDLRLRQIAPDCKIAVIDSHKLGPAWAIREAREFINLNTQVVVNYCDFSCTWDFKEFRNQLESGLDGLIATYSGFHPHMLTNSQYAYLKLDKNGFLSGIREKLSFTDSPMGEPASSGSYGFGSGKTLLNAINSQIEQGNSYKNEFYSSLTYVSMIENGLMIRNFEIDKFFQWGTPEDFEEFKMYKDFFTFRCGDRNTQINADRIEILAAGAGQRFIDAGYKYLKPFLPLGSSFLAIEAIDALGRDTKSKGILLQEDFPIPRKFSMMLEQNGLTLTTVNGLTKGQASSALLAIQRFKDGNCIIATCDSLVFPRETDNLGKFTGKTLIVWATKPTPYALNNPMQFGWVSTNKDNEILASWVKVRPETKLPTKTITGTFFFGDSQEARILLEDFLREGVTVNNEYYLDSVLDFAAKSGWKVIALEPAWFVSLGTPGEYETYLYWESLFYQRQDLLIND